MHVVAVCVDAVAHAGRSGSHFIWSRTQQQAKKAVEDLEKNAGNQLHLIKIAFLKGMCIFWHFACQS